MQDSKRYFFINYMIRNGYTYILSNKPFGILYIGVTSNLEKRIYEHKHNLIKGFTSLYYVHLLVYYEVHDSIQEAIYREKILKSWRRQWKIELISKFNPKWEDLYNKLFNK